MGMLGFLNTGEVLGQNSSCSNDIQLEASIQFANYTDWDNDEFEDDIFILLALDFTAFKSSATATVDITVALELPSGIILVGSVRISVYATDQVITLYSLDAATEAGWYTVTVTTVLLGNSPDVSVSQYLFDPPTGKGNGLPE
jgi:hypothetical protein